MRLRESYQVLVIQKTNKTWFLSSKNLTPTEIKLEEKRKNLNKAISNSYTKSKYYLVQF